ncbi:MAG: hypothetical protein MUE44_04835 [Oscillatoriaceae cyanobacterium Prado104]|jgi:hypothetical protein|nr:hypothetical protein [Oscillatoriaceae cyanobacterium Prado104]
MKLSKLNLYLSGAVLVLGIGATIGANAGIVKSNISEKSPQNLAQTLPPPPPSTPSPTPIEGGEEGPPIAAESGPDEIALATHLQRINARMYGAYWCPHCHAQQELFGKEAFSAINYIECAPRGKDAQPDLCKAANIKAYPTWVIRGKSYMGAQSLEKLAILSGYRGSRNFGQPVPVQ